MASIERLEAGIAKWIDNEVAPKIPTDGPYGQLKKLAAVSGAIYVVRRRLRDFVGGPAAEQMGILNGDGDLDVRGLAEIVKGHIPEKGLKVPVPMLQEMALTFRADDVDVLLKYIEEG